MQSNAKGILDISKEVDGNPCYVLPNDLKSMQWIEEKV